MLGERDRAMPLVDLARLRDAADGAVGWVSDARVSRQLPDTIVVDIVERTPARGAAQNPSRLVLIDDRRGTMLEPVSPARRRAGC